jgi:hypothetical protein
MRRTNDLSAAVSAHVWWMAAEEGAGSASAIINERSAETTIVVVVVAVAAIFAGGLVATAARRVASVAERSNESGTAWIDPRGATLRRLKREGSVVRSRNRFLAKPFLS